MYALRIRCHARNMRSTTLSNLQTCIVRIDGIMAAPQTMSHLGQYPYITFHPLRLGLSMPWIACTACYNNIVQLGCRLIAWWLCRPPW